jgi:hypothetical protein
MQQSGDYTPNAAHVSALTSVVQTLLALEPKQEAADALVARPRRASRHLPRFVADDDQHERHIYVDTALVWSAGLMPEYASNIYAISEKKRATRDCSPAHSTFSIRSTLDSDRQILGAARPEALLVLERNIHSRLADGPA